MMLLLCALVAGGSVWAESVEISPSQALNDGGVDPITIVCAKGDGTSNPAISSSQLRLYQASSGKTTGNTITFSSEKTITSIVFTFANNMTADNGSFSEGTYNSSSSTWTGSTNEVTLTVTGTSSSTRIYITKMVVTYTVPSAYSITATSNNNSWGTVSGTTLITATPAAGYRVKDGDEGYTVTSGTATVTNNGDNTFSVSASSDCTIQINFEAIPVYTVTFGDDNSTLTEELGDAGVTLPARDAFLDYTFAGWYSTNITAETTIAPTDIIPAGEYKPTADITLYPIYTRVEGSLVEVTKSVTIETYATDNSWVNEKKNPVPTSGTASTSIINLDGSITITSGSGSNSGKYYSSDYSWRIYEETNGGFTIAGGEGITLKTATITYTPANNGVLVYNETNYSSEDEISLSGNSAAFTVTHTSGNKNGNARITAITVTYTSGNGTTYYTSSPVTTSPVAISSAKYATYCGVRSLDFSTTGITAYTATDGKTKVTLNEITSGKVPANTPVVLYKAGADGTAINVPVTASADAVEGTNDLHVSTGTDVDYMYVLANKSGVVGFYPWGGTNLSAGKIYLQGKASYGARSFIGFDDVTAVKSMEALPAIEGAYYNLNGQQVAQPAKGLYIVNGKKIVIK